MTGAHKGRVLCVDDEPHVVRALQWLLKKEFDVHTATSAVEGLRVLSQFDFDVVVSDQRMPGITGVEFLHEVRRSAPRATRILLTGYSDQDAMVRSVNECEVYRFVTKPWDILELPRLIGEAAGIARQTPGDAPDPGPDGDAKVVFLSDARAAAKGARETAPGHLAATAALRSGEDILVIDDDPDTALRQAVHDAIGDAVRVHHATTLAEAVRMLDERPASVVISDVRVGQVDVTRLIRLMKQKYPEVVAVVFSGVQDAQVVMDLINQGQVYRFIPKPFKPGFVRLVVDSAIRRHRQLADSPETRRRFQVEPAGEEAARSLRRDVEAVALGGSPAGAIAPLAATGFVEESGDAGQGFMQRISGGFRRLFGA